MPRFVPLKGAPLPDGFDATIHGEQPIVEIDERADRVVITYAFPGFQLATDPRQVPGSGDRFHQVNVTSVGYRSREGEPLLPSLGRFVQIPAGHAYAVSVDKGEPHREDGMVVLPAQETLSDAAGATHIFEYDAALYARDEVFPACMVEHWGPLEIDGYHGVLLHVCPFEYNPARAQLVGYGRVTVTLALSATAGAAPPSVPPDTLDREAYGNLFLNPRRRVEDRLGIAPAVTYAPHGPELLVVYAPPLRKAAEELACWKERRGLMTETVSLPDAGRDAAGLKAFVRARRSTTGARLRYLLLLGDVQDIPSENVDAVRYKHSPNVTDLYYTTPRDPAGPEDCVLPWMAGGRIPVSDLEGALGIVSQIVDYEQNPPTEAAYYRRVTCAGKFQAAPEHPRRECNGYLKCIESVASHLESLGYEVERVYVTDSDDPRYYTDGAPLPPHVTFLKDHSDATDALVAATTEGRLFIGHRDHGRDDGWESPPFDVHALGRVTGTLPTVFFSVNCSTGQFDLRKHRECFAEKNLRMRGTAPSLVAASRPSQTFLNNHLMRGMVDAMFGGLVRTYGAAASYPVKCNRLGDILNYAKTYLLVARTGRAWIKDHCEIYHVIGDPTLELWKEAPLLSPLEVRLTPAALHVKLPACPAGTVVTVWSGARLVRRLHPTSPVVSIPLCGIVAPSASWLGRDVKVCFWAPGYRFAEVSPRVEAPRPHAVAAPV